MLVLNKNDYVSPCLKQWMNDVKCLYSMSDDTEKNVYQAPDFKTALTLEELRRRNELFYTPSESNLDWIIHAVRDEKVLNGIRIFKNKYLFRQVISDIYPDFVFKKISCEELSSFDPDSLKYPYILKPSVGFFSAGVYTIFNKNDWNAAVSDIEKQKADWEAAFSKNVVNSSEFMIEQYIHGDEYAVDFYYNSKGKAVVLNIFRHEFASARDVSDRLYYTSIPLIKQHLDPFTSFLDKMNEKVGTRNLPCHLELRIDNGRILPIEANVMRFAGWCLTDLSLYAYGFRTYDLFFKDAAPDWKNAEALAGENIFSFIVLSDAGLPVPTIFDPEKLQAGFADVLETRLLPERSLGFLFTKTNPAHREELDRILQSHLKEYLK